MLTIDQMREALEHVTYKPGWRLTLFQHQWEGIWMAIRAELPDADWPTRTTVININTPVPPMRDIEGFYEWLAWRLARVEIHEMREFLRIDGVKYSDPHAPDANDG
jgi:hypothetical protein